MKTLCILAALCACAYADAIYGHNTIPYATTYVAGAHPYAAGAYPYAAYNPYVSAYPVQYHATKKAYAIPDVVPSGQTQQYHAQDSLGQFSFGYTNPLNARSEVKSADGIVKGQYSYVQPQGNVVQVKYVADDQGYRVENNVPQTIGFRSKRDTPASTVKIGEPQHLYPAYAGAPQYFYSAAGVQPLYYGDNKAATVKYNFDQAEQFKYLKSAKPLVAFGQSPYYPSVYPYGIPIPVTKSFDYINKPIVGDNVQLAGAEYPKTLVHA